MAADWYLLDKPRADGRWAAKYRRDRHDRWRWVYGKTKTEAKTKLQTKLHELEDGLTADGWTVGAWVDRWLGRGDWPALTTQDNYAYRLGLLPDWFRAVPLKAVTAEQVEQLLDDLLAAKTAHGKPRSPRTVADVRTVLLQVFRDAHGRRLIGWNPVEPTRPPRYRAEEPEPLDVDEAGRLLQAVGGHRLESMWIVMLSLGLRISEVSWLRWSDVDLEAGTLTVRRTRTRTAAGRIQERDDTKSDRSRRRIRLPRSCIDAMRVWKVEQAAERLAAGPAWHDLDLVWPTTVGTPYDRGNLRRTLSRACKRAGIRHVNPHLLRHSAASFMLAQGIPSRTIMDVLGQSSDRMIRRYQHVHDSLRDDAAAAMDSLFDGMPKAADGDS